MLRKLNEDEDQTNWFKAELDKLRAVIGSYPIPAGPIKDSISGDTIINPELFIQSHIEMIEKLRRPQLQLPYILRLERYASIMAVMYGANNKATK